MIKSKLRITSLLCLATILISCNSSTNDQLNEKPGTIDNAAKQIDNIDNESKKSFKSTAEAQAEFDSIVSGFVEKLKNGEDLSSFFNQSWSFVYHEDNRCEGSTDGQVEDLSKAGIDSIINVHVQMDGDAWACDKKEPKSYTLDFELKEKISTWDRFEVPDYENQEEKAIYVLGAGESDYLIVHFNDNNLIVKLAYRSEDPG